VIKAEWIGWTLEAAGFKIVKAAPKAVLIVVTDPPDPLADVAREAADGSAMLSMGTYLDSQRFRVHLGKHFGVDAAHEASQYGIGIVSVRVAEMVLKDERALIPIGSFQRNFEVTLYLPGVVGSTGVAEVLVPEMSDEEHSALERSAGMLRAALDHIR
jgi:L-lactate dehydrogenase